MSGRRVIDTFPAFLALWPRIQKQALPDQIEAWATEYLSEWPELLTKQVDDYASQGVDWRQIAREKVFPFLAGRLPAMQEAHRNLVGLCLPVYARAQEVLGFDADAVFVIHVGIGCGAGWVTSFGGSPSILFGLECIAECGWGDAEALAGLVAHEIGHLAHYHWRARHGKTMGAGPWWQLYEEGFAQRCESLILKAEHWHQAGPDNNAGWLRWCHNHQGWLAAEFLRTVDAGQPVTPFFGSWLDICGRSEMGYFLGYQVMWELEQRLGWRESALLQNAEESLRPVVEQLASGAGG